MVYVREVFEVFVSEEQFTDQRAVFVLDFFDAEVPGCVRQLEFVHGEEVGEALLWPIAVCTATIPLST